MQLLLEQEGWEPTDHSYQIRLPMKRPWPWPAQPIMTSFPSGVIIYQFKREKFRSARYVIVTNSDPDGISETLIGILPMLALAFESRQWYGGKCRPSCDLALLSQCRSLSKRESTQRLPELSTQLSDISRHQLQERNEALRILCPSKAFEL